MTATVAAGCQATTRLPSAVRTLTDRPGTPFAETFALATVSPALASNGCIVAPTREIHRLCKDAEEIPDHPRHETGPDVRLPPKSL
ncbi:hypothetical protein FRACA_90045 [Frankia canadensis]|uniref:Uncharacterized protein n=1 Tax=Frankia canadensis TaxID=1836972 RepID=A0A2I2L2A0_9ACTN|nr:hypothetical protein FRACA_90045 [Frankia canadensis]SOU59332.1 hypothetical protein FRACA_90045 [Frankia canadensis]